MRWRLEARPPAFADALDADPPQSWVITNETVR
jgi:hypothetical protein